MIYLQEVYEVKFLSDKAVAGSICRHDTGTKSIMNGCNVYDGRNHIFAAGLDDECHIYSLKYKVTSPDKNEKGTCINALSSDLSFKSNNFEFVCFLIFNSINTDTGTLFCKFCCTFSFSSGDFFRINYYNDVSLFLILINELFLGFN